MFNFFKNKKRKTFLLLFLGFFLFSFFKKIKKDEDLEDRIDDVKHNFIDFLHKEKKQVQDLQSGKKDLKSFVYNTKKIFWNYFIPGNHNNHKPKILHTHSLILIALAIFVLKFFLLVYIFFIPQNKAMMSADFQQSLLSLINKDRIANGLLPLKENKNLDFFATLKGEDMIKKKYFSHYSPSGKRPWDWIDKSKYDYLYVGENLAMNFDNPEDVHRALMNSQHHKENILNDKFEDVGFAVLRGKIENQETSILVELFATKNKNLSKNKKSISTSTKTSPAILLGQNDLKQAGTSVLSTQNYNQKIKPIIKSVKTPTHNSLFKLNNKAIFYKKTNKKKLYYFSLEKAVNITIFTLLAIIILVLLVKILIKAEVEHRPVIAQTLLLVFFILILYLFKTNYFKTPFDILIIV